MLKNFYLELFKEKLNSIQNLVDRGIKKNLSNDIIEYTVAGQVILLNSIFEAGINQLHSKDMEPIFNALYKLRQQVIHYDYFQGRQDVVQITANLKKEFNDLYEQEQVLFSNLSNFNVKKEVTNVLIQKNILVKKEKNYYHFYDNQNENYLLVPENKVFRIDNGATAIQYVVDLSQDYIITDGTNVRMKKDCVKFFEDNYQVLEHNFKNHYLAFDSMLNKFSNKPYNSLNLKIKNSKLNTATCINDFCYKRRIEKALLDRVAIIPNNTSLHFHSIKESELYPEITNIKNFYTTN